MSQVQNIDSSQDPYGSHTFTLENPRDYLTWRKGSGNTVEIVDIQVKSPRRRGKGRKLVYHLIDVACPTGTRLVWAITRSTNLIAHRFYEGIGFRVVGVLAEFYRDEPNMVHTIDAVMYGREVG